MDSHGQPVSQLQYSTYLPSIGQSLEVITNCILKLYALANECFAADRFVLRSPKLCTQRLRMMQPERLLGAEVNLNTITESQLPYIPGPDNLR
jgi:hypothetical protein